MIAFICHPYHRGGVTRWMVDMAIAYARRGEKVFFITVNPARPFYSSGGTETIISMLEDTRVNVVAEKAGWAFELGTQTYRATVYATLLTRHVPAGTSVILSDDFAAWEVSGLLKGQYRFVGVLHADDKAYYNLALTYKNSIDVFTCVSKRVKQTLLQLADFSNEAVHVIPCGIHLPRVKRAVYANDTIKLAYIGRVTEHQKRVTDLVKVATGLKNENINFTLKVIGDGEDRVQFEKEVTAAKLEQYIEMLGWLPKEKIFEILSATDLVLLTSAFEGMPIAAMEGLSAGCGIISTRVSGVEDYEFNTFALNSMWLNDVGDTEKAVANIKKAMQVSGNTRLEAATQLAASEFSMEICMSRYDEVISEFKESHVSGSNKLNGFWTKMQSYPRAFARLLKMKYA